MKSVGTRFLIPFGILTVLSSLFVFYQTYESSRKHAYELISQQAAMALEFNLAIRGYARENILPVMEKYMNKDGFIPETMSTSFISRSIFEKVKQKFPGDIIRFASDNPRNPINRATPDDERMIEYFQQNPQVKRRIEEIQIDGRRYLAHFSPMLMRDECMRCHSDPKDAPAELIKRYGSTASFHRKLGEVVGLDRVAVPIDAVTASLASEIRSRSLVLAAVFTLLFGSIFYVFRFVVTRRLVALASHFDEIAEHAESPWMTPVEVKGNDEISVVGHAFNKLVEQLRATHTSLEQRVSERTEELRHANAQLQLELTERQRAEEQLEKSLSLQNATLESTADGILVVNREGRMMSSNHKFREMWRLPEDIVASGDDNRALAYVADQLEDPQGFLQKVRELYDQPAAESFDVCHFKDGHVFERYSIPQYLNNQIVGRVWSFRDVTESKRGEAALRESEEKYRGLIETTNTGYVIVDAEGKVLDANPEYVRLTGNNELKEIIGRSVIEWTAEPDREKNAAAMAQCIEAGLIKHLELDYAGRGGRSIPVEINATTISTSEGVKSLSLVRDISDRKRAEDEKAKLEAQLVQAQKLEAIGTLAGGIAHDFNNILTAIIGNISLAMLDPHMEAQSRERLTESERACLQAQNLSRQLLTFSRGGAPVKEVVSVKRLITESAAFACRGSQVSYDSSLPDNLRAVEADPGQISQVFQNLVINAIQAMPTGGMIKIRGENVEAAPGSELPLDAGRYVKVSIQDTGIGVSAEHLSRIFDPYFTTKQQGSGLGLATSYSIIRNHHGHISAESELGKGATFNVYLPASDQQVMQHPQEDRGLLFGEGKILLMDDEPMVLEVVGRMVTTLGYEAQSARDGVDALELFIEAQKSGHPFAGVILDLTIPGGMGGKEAMARLLHLDPQVKAIVSSGYSDDPIMADFQKYGFTAVIAKPYKISELGKVLHKAIIGA